MKIISLNVNGLRSAVKKGLIPWLQKENADIICLQEIKCTPDQFNEIVQPLKPYHASSFCAQKKGYSGVAILSLKEPDKIHHGLAWEPCNSEGRYLQMDFGNTSIASIYLPSGSSGAHRQVQKFAFMEHFQKDLLRIQKSGQQFIFCGDLNIVRTELDIKNWRSNQKNSGCLPEEREWLNKILNQFCLLDIFRSLYPDKVQYSWWSQRGQAFANDIGWRIDYHLVTKTLANKLISLEMLRHPKFSDHAALIGIYR